MAAILFLTSQSKSLLNEEIALDCWYDLSQYKQSIAHEVIDSRRGWPMRGLGTINNLIETQRKPLFATTLSPAFLERVAQRLYKNSNLAPARYNNRHKHIFWYRIFGH